MKPPIYTREQKLPFSQLPWHRFEDLCLRLIGFDESIEHKQRYGVQGEEQGGIDIYARHSNDASYTTYQCKNVKNFGPADIKSAVDVFLEGDWAQRSSVFVLCTRESLTIASLTIASLIPPAMAKANSITCARCCKAFKSERFRFVPC